MNRTEFMTELASMMQDIPVEERQEAMKYYNDYFDDAGTENEQEVIRELGSPAKVVEKIKADLNMQQAGESGPEDPAAGQAGSAGYEGTGAAGSYESNLPRQEKPWSSKVLKVILIIAIICVGGWIIIPCALAILGVAAGILISIFAVLFSLVILFVSLVIAGVVLICAGVVSLLPEIAVGLALIGTGLIIGVVGVVGTVASIKLCIVAVPGICRGIVTLCRKPFHKKRKAVV